MILPADLRFPHPRDLPGPTSSTAAQCGPCLSAGLVIFFFPFLPPVACLVRQAWRRPPHGADGFTEPVWSSSMPLSKVSFGLVFGALLLGSAAGNEPAKHETKPTDGAAAFEQL